MEIDIYSKKRKAIGLIGTFLSFAVIIFVELYDPATTTVAVWGVSLISSILFFFFYLVFTSPKGTKITVIHGVFLPNRNIKTSHFVAFCLIYFTYLAMGYCFSWLAK